MVAYEERSSSWFSLDYWVSAADFFCRDWWNSRPGGLWAVGLTSLVAVGLLAVLVVIPRAMEGRIRQSYERRWAAAEKAEEWDVAELWLQRLINLGDSRPALRYQLGMIAERTGRGAQAEAIVRAVATESNFVPALAWLAAKSLDENATKDQIDKAIFYLRDALRLNGNDVNLRAALADALVRSGTDVSLKEATIQLLTVADKLPEYNLQLARTYAELKELDAAREYAAIAERYFQDKLLKAPEETVVVNSVCDAMLLQGKWEKALEFVSLRVIDEAQARELKSRIHTVASDELIKKQETAIEAIRHLYQALEESPTNRFALTRLARLAPSIVRINRDEIEPIRKWMAMAYEASPDDLELIMLMGMLYMQPGPGRDLDKAEELFAKAAKVEPLVLIDLAQIQAQLGKEERRVETLREAVARFSDKSDDTTKFALSQALTMLGRYEEAEKTLLDAIAVKPTAMLRQSLSQVYFRQAEKQNDDPNAKIRLLFNAVKTSEGHNPSEAMLAELAGSNAELKQTIQKEATDLVASGESIRGGHMILGVIAARENKWEEGGFHFEQALSQAPNDPLLQNNVAWALASRNGPGDAKRSLELAEKAVQQFPLNADIRATRGLALLINRQWARAISDFEFALKFYPERKHFHRHLATAYGALGQKEIAERHSELAN